MKSKSEHEKRERQDWAIVLIILLIGFLCVAVAGQWALRLSPSWKLNTDMESNLDPNSDFSPGKPIDFIEPLEEGILTKPAWESLFLTPGAHFVTGTPLPPSTATVPTTELPTLPVGTNTLIATVTPVPTNTFIWLPPPPATNTKKPKPADTPTNTAVPGATLAVTITDGVIVHDPGTPKTYTIVVSNTVAGSNVIGATVTDLFTAQMLTHDWTCVGSVPGATCTASGSGDISDLVNLPFGSWVTYTVSVTTDGTTADLVNTASVSLPAGYTGPTPISATDTDTTTAPPPWQIDIGLPDPLHEIYDAPQGEVLTLAVTVVANGDPGPDLVYYELPSGPGILMDWVRIEISDGYNWYTVFDWGDGNPDTNTNVASFSPPEPDQLPIPAVSLYNGQGVAIDVDSIVPPGNYPYIRITCSPYGIGADSGRTDIDAIEPLTP